jgi:hypothetical protein
MMTKNIYQIKDALKNGVVDGAEIVVNYNLQIK